MNPTRFLSALCLLLIVTFSACHTTHTEEEKNSDDVKSTYCLTDSLMEKVSIDTAVSKPVFNEIDLRGHISFLEDKVVRVYPLAGGHLDRKSTRLNSSHIPLARMPSSA